jgi:hypothetical protein
MKSGVIFLSGLICLLLGCSKPPKSVPIDLDASVPVYFSTSLADTLPASTFKKLRVKNVAGVKINDIHGTDIRYFEYAAKREDLLAALTESPFSIEADLSDTVCRKLTADELQRALSYFRRSETQYSSVFSCANECEVYECIKPPLRHLVRVNRSTNKIYHRTERI